ncbi:MAG: Trk system potassium transporter TrkA [Candidatus Woesearchaeota archaeon]
MQVVIYGIGAVGTKIAETLYEEGHDVTVIDPYEKKIAQIQKSLDVLGITGHIGDAEVIENLKTKGANIFIATTDSDEENIIASIIAKKQNIKKTIARIRNPAYLNKMLLDTSEIGIDHVINPEREVAKEIQKIISIPWASEVDSFMNGRIFLIEVKANYENIGYLNKKLAKVSKTNNIIVVESEEYFKKLKAFEHRKKVKIGDHIFILQKGKGVDKINKIFGDVYKKINNIMITGGGVTGSELLRLIENSGIKIKLIEKNKKKCAELSKRFRNSLILYGDATDLDLLRSEKIEKIDCFIAITGDDEENVMISLLAKQHGAKKVITKISKDYEEDIISEIGLDAAVNLSKITANKILQFVRREELLALSILDKELAIMEFIASPNSKIVKKPVKEAQFIKGAIIGAVIRNEETFFPRNNFKIEPNDKVLVFVRKKAASSVERYFKG